MSEGARKQTEEGEGLPRHVAGLKCLLRTCGSASAVWDWGGGQGTGKQLGKEQVCVAALQAPLLLCLLVQDVGACKEFER